MLENFIYARKKSLFESALNNGEVPDEAIAFIEDTKEIWNHGTYFDCSTFDPSSKVDVVPGKQLSTNDFTNELKTKLENSNVYKHQFRTLSALPDSGDGWYSIASIGDTESSIVQISSGGHTDVQVAINTGWASNTTGSLTVLNSFVDDTNPNHAFIKAVRLRKIPNSNNGVAVLEAKINRTGYYNYTLYVNVVVSVFTNAGHNIITTNSEHAQTLLLVNDDSNVLQEFTLTDKAIMAKNIVAETITANNLAPVATSGSFEDLSDKPTYTWSDIFDTTRTVPNLDFNATGNNADTYGYIGNLSTIGIEGDNVLIDLISVYVREGSRSPNLTTKVWCRLLRFKNEAWEIVYESTESKTINDIAPETLFTFKMRNVTPDRFIKASDKIAIVYANDQNNVLSSTQLGFKVIVGILGCIISELTNSSTSNSNFIPAFVIDYAAFGLSTAVYSTKLEDDLKMTTAVGGLAVNTTAKLLKGKTYTELFDAILFPDQNPSYTDASVTNFTLSSSTSPIEVGSNMITVTNEGDLNRGSWDLYNVQLDNTNLPYTGRETGRTYEFTVNGTTYTSTTGIPTITDKTFTTPGNNTFKLTIDYGAGPTPKNNKGADVSSLAASSGSKSKEYVINATYPFWVLFKGNTEATKQTIACSIGTTSGTISFNKIGTLPAVNNNSGADPVLFKVKGLLTTLKKVNILNATAPVDMLGDLKSEVVDGYTVYRYKDGTAVGEQEINNGTITFNL